MAVWVYGTCLFFNEIKGVFVLPGLRKKSGSQSAVNSHMLFLPIYYGAGGDASK